VVDAERLLEVDDRVGVALRRHAVGLGDPAYAEEATLRTVT